MGKTSVYLSDELAEAVRASGLPLAELIRRGLDVSGSIESVIARVVRAELAAWADGRSEPEPAAVVPQDGSDTEEPSAARTEPRAPGKAPARKPGPEPARSEPAAVEAPPAVAASFPAPRLPRWRG